MKSHDSLGERIAIRDRENERKHLLLEHLCHALTSMGTKDPSMWARLQKLLLGSEEGFQEGEERKSFGWPAITMAMTQTYQ